MQFIFLALAIYASTALGYTRSHPRNFPRQLKASDAPAVAKPVAPAPVASSAPAAAATVSPAAAKAVPAAGKPVAPAAGKPVAAAAAGKGSATVSYELGKPTMTVASYAAGATPPVPGAPALPQPFVLNSAEWPPLDKIPPTNSPEVLEWMKELDGKDIPALSKTVDGTCAADPEAAADSESRGWWSCGGVTRETDIVDCKDKGTWGVSFDDGPAEYTATLLDFLNEKDIKATFFVVGSRVLERPEVLIHEYMTSHEISVHTWSHAKAMTAMTNEEIVAELGWTRKAIKEVLGVTPTTMRPPLGDIDDRVRAISMAMGMVPIMWSRAPNGDTFDTNDWKVPGGETTVDQSLQVFEGILGNASTLDTGFIVLQHDQHEVTVDMAIDKTLNSALNRSPPFKLQKISECMKYEPGEFYKETSKVLSATTAKGPSGSDAPSTGAAAGSPATPGSPAPAAPAAPGSPAPAAPAAPGSPAPAAPAAADAAGGAEPADPATPGSPAAAPAGSPKPAPSPGTPAAPASSGSPPRPAASTSVKVEAASSTSGPIPNGGTAIHPALGLPFLLVSALHFLV